MGLFTPIWAREGLKGEKLGNAIFAVRKIKKQSELRRVAVQAHHGQIIGMAMDQIDDQAFLERIALGQEPVASSEAISCAASRIVDQNVLEQVARTSSNEFARMFATGRISDVAVIIDIARHATDEFERSQGLGVARERLKHAPDSLLGQLAMTDPDLCATAVEQLGCPSLRMYRNPEREAMAVDIALTSPFEAAWRKALDILHPAALASVAKRDFGGARGWAAIDRIVELCHLYAEDEEAIDVLVEAALLDSDNASRAAACISGKCPRLAEVACNAPRLEARKAAVKNLLDTEVLARLALTDPDVCVEAAKSLTDQQCLKELLLERFDAEAVAANASLDDAQKEALFNAAVAAIGNLDDLKAARQAAEKLAAASDAYAQRAYSRAQEVVARLKKTYRRFVCQKCGQPIFGKRSQDCSVFWFACGCPEGSDERNWRLVVDEDGERSQHPLLHQFVGGDVWVCTNCHGLKSAMVGGKMPTKPRCSCEGAWPYKDYFEFRAKGDDDAVAISVERATEEELDAAHELGLWGVFGSSGR